MGGLDGYMGRIADWVVVYETRRKDQPVQSQLKRNKSKVCDRPKPNDPFLLHSPPSAEDASFSRPFHQEAGVGQQVRGRECAGHQPQVVVEAGDTAGAPMRDSWSFSLVEWGEAMEGCPRRTF
jgi:hypothetical protein